MSTHQQFRLVDDTPKSRMGRMLNSIRSYWKGPYTLSTITSSLFGDSPTASAGVAVSEQTALTYSAFWACVNAISTDVASLPLMLYKRLPNGGKERFSGHRLYEILHDEPNDENGSMTMRETLTAHVLTWGNGYAEIERDELGRTVALWPITPDRVEPFRDDRRRINYRVKQPGGGEPVVIQAADMLHVHGLGFDGLVGYSVVAMARQSIGLGLATEGFGSTFFGNGSTVGGVITYKGPKPPAAAEKNLEEVLAAKHQGVGKAHKLLALYNDATYTRMGIPPNDAQFLETRLHQVEEICRYFRMPPHKIQHLLRATNNNIEHQGIEYSTDTLHPWCVRWEQEINRKLISRAERKIQYAEHLIDGKFRGDLPSRYAAYAIGRQWGWLSADDVREKENLNPLPDGIGKVYLLPLNMTPADRISEIIDAQIKAKTAPPAPPAGDNGAAQKNALEMVDAIRVSLTETQEKAEAHLARAVAAEAAATQATDGGAVFKVEAETERAAALELAREVGTLKALLVEATDRVAGERAARELADEDAATARAAEAAAVAHAAAVQAERDAAVEAARLTLAEREQALRDAETRLEERDGWLPPADVATDKAEIIATHEAAMNRLVMDVDTRERERDAAICAVRQAEARAGEQATALANAAEELASQQDGEQKRLVAVIGAHRSLIVDAMGRMIRRETEKARRAQATPEKLRAWIASFYPVHDEICRAALLPAIRAHVAWTQSGDDPAIVTSGFVRQHIEESVRQLLAVLESDPEDYAETLETTLRRWELERSDVLADVILQEAVGYVGQR